MRKFEFFIFYVLTFLVLSLMLTCSADPLKQPKRLSNNQQRLFSFPRVGRGENSWDIDMGKTNPGRYALFAFPRIGKSERNIVSKRNGANNMNAGLWFGPRLGRVQKRDILLFDLASDYPKNEIFPELEHRQVNFTPRLERDSEESDDIEDKEMDQVM